MWLCWNSYALELFRKLDRDIWEESLHNLKAMLGLVKQTRLEELGYDTSFIFHIKRVKAEFDKYISVLTWFDTTFPEYKDKKLYIFLPSLLSMKTYLYIFQRSCILSGDHLKSSSDMGLPLVGIGLLYRNGCFKQHLSIVGSELFLQYVYATFNRWK